MTEWTPKSSAQQEALRCHGADILLFGGAAGSLKSETMLVDAVQEHDRRGLRALLLRRSFPELEKSLIRRSRDLYGSMGAVYNDQKKRWTFPSGAMVEFGYCETEKDIHRYQGAEFSFIGFDESTHFSEFPIRYMLSRLRSTDPGIRLRVRLATNPGNVGHATHKAIFHGPTCTHCHIGEGSRVPFVIYREAVWPSDQHPIGKTTCFIPGRVTDHSLLGPSYIANLESLGGAFRKALLDGCWDVYEGQYFDHWNPIRMTIRRPLVGEQEWWPHWVGIDYGFRGSQAAAYLLCKSPASREQPHGCTFVLEEYCARHETAEVFARALRDRFAISTRRIFNWYLSPDSWNQRGDGHTLADQMTAATGIGFEPASNDRIGGAMLVYSQLDRGELVVADSCRQLCEALPTRIHSADRPDDICKISGDPLDDCMDALRYALYSYIAPPGIPSRLAAGSLVASNDPTIAMVQRRLAEAHSCQNHTRFRYLSPRRL
ncbi:MAG TPA: terminase family protein [Terriglobales bacterium]|nr:terminase family protein [Terriglobales bacterium]